MPITEILEQPNDEFPKITPVKEHMDIDIPDIIKSVPHYNGFIWVLAGSGGSGKTSLMLNFFKKKDLYRMKFDNIYYICPESSFLSVKNHPFQSHDKIYHELNGGVLESIYNELSEMKEQSIKDPEEYPLRYNCVIIDDMASELKNIDIQKALHKILIKTRHLCTAFIFTLQAFKYFPMMSRKQITNITIFKPKNYEEWDNFNKEMMGFNKDDAKTIYDYVFDELYNHIDIDMKTGKYYKNFNLLEFVKK
jgi:hypothetical protein